MAINKVVFGNQTLIDLTADTITPADLANGVTAHDASGAAITGTSTLDSDTSADTALVGEILSGKTAHARGAQLTGTMPNRGAIDVDITTVNQSVSVPQGYHDGSGTVQIDSTEQAKIIPGNIKDGVSVLGVLGTYTGEGVTAQVKNATPYTTAQTILPDAGYDYLSEVDVAAISYVETPNAAGGNTATIGDVAPI
ncbi:MAG: hypothetical protein J6Y02_12495 [Pseudobutyrivibrio sp.]|nr:hypothetical protein [Pseudobutyrivibrio sp.]